MTFNRNSLISSIFFLALLLLGVMLLVSQRIGARLDQSNLWTHHTYEVLEALDDTTRTLLSAENSRRGYILTGNSSFRQQYLISAREVPVLLARLKKLTADNDAQQRRIVDLQQLTQERLLDLGSSLTPDNRGEGQAQVTEERSLLISAIETKTNEIKAAEQNLLRERRSTEQNVLRALIVVLLAGIFLAVALLAGAFYFARRESASRETTAAMLMEKSQALEAANKEMADLKSMTDLLQSATSLAEAGEVLSSFGAKFFPGDCGAIYLLNASRNLLADLASWGGSQQASFAPEACWALRRGQAHVAHDSSAVRCPHVGEKVQAYLCTPLAAQHETLGILHIGMLAPVLEDDLERRRELASAMADQVGLALRNIQLREQLRETSIRDPLTGLLNRRYMEEALVKEVARAQRGKAPLSVVIIDVDHFKSYNDTFGHEGGDFVLKEFGQLLRQVIRDSDVACRFGGEEFVLILPEASREVAGRRANEIREKVKQLQLLIGARSLGRITISAGVAALPENGDTGAALLSAADAALYRAKLGGRDRVELA
jgi:diguanylate cyclase (GGDEF)-like protein